MNAKPLPIKTSETNGPNIERGLRLAVSSSEHRKAVDQLLRRCQALPSEDRDILRAIYDGGQTAAQMARLAGQSPRVLRRRVDRLVKRVLSREFAFVVNHRADWSDERRAVADAIFIEGHSVKKAARVVKLSYHLARRHFWAILSLLERHEAGLEVAA